MSKSSKLFSPLNLSPFRVLFSPLVRVITFVVGNGVTTTSSATQQTDNPIIVTIPITEPPEYITFEQQTVEQSPMNQPVDIDEPEGPLSFRYDLRHPRQTEFPEIRRRKSTSTPNVYVETRTVSPSFPTHLSAIPVDGSSPIKIRRQNNPNEPIDDFNYNIAASSNQRHSPSFPVRQNSQGTQMQPIPLQTIPSNIKHTIPQQFYHSSQNVQQSRSTNSNQLHHGYTVPNNVPVHSYQSSSSNTIPSQYIQHTQNSQTFSTDPHQTFVRDHSFGHFNDSVPFSNNAGRSNVTQMNHSNYHTLPLSTSTVSAPFPYGTNRVNFAPTYDSCNQSQFYQPCIPSLPVLDRSALHNSTVRTESVNTSRIKITPFFPDSSGIPSSWLNLLGMQFSQRRRHRFSNKIQTTNTSITIATYANFIYTFSVSNAET